ncbi:MAG: hypothetical protein HN704_12495 [Bacteroidetes bacterium]|nr:hypothetical protein [Bacteroidota bacterium]MBT6688015.1 hypothetical protein [Bacteroidota bacterium]MBT7144821.1 hypothetical protein [Bacteroidota bacterium]MBT7492412.1 hypothetical protein [Bacteroidota bacterium]
MKKFLFILLILYFSVAKAQKRNRFIQFDNIEYKFNYGTIAPHRSSIRYLQRGHIPSFEIILSQQKNGEKLWEQLFRYPTVGLGYYFSYLNYPEVLGNAHALFTFINVPLLKFTRYSINYNLAFGVSYITKPFDIDKNYYNVAIGSNANVYLNFAIDQKIRLSKKLELLLGIGLTHYSNGSIKKPNLGLNILSAQTGIKYFFSKEEKPKIITQKPKIQNPYNFQIVYSAGYKRIYPPGENIFLTSSLTFDAERAIFIKYGLGLGFDIFYNSSLYEKLKKENVENLSKLYNFRGGIHLRYKINFGKLSYYMQIGYYLYTKWQADRNIYNKFGLNYYFSKHYIANLGVKTHLGKADFIEWGFGYRF